MQILYPTEGNVLKNKTNGVFSFMVNTSNPENWENVDVSEYKAPEVTPTVEEQAEALTRFSNTITGANDPDLISAAETLIEQRIKEE